jgi:hypothetical protein
MIIAFTHTYIHRRSSLTYFVFRHACYLNCLLSLPYRDGRRYLQSCKYHKLAIPYIHTLHVYTSIHTWTSPCSNLLSPAFSSLPFSPLAVHRPNYMEGSSSSRLAIVTIRRVSHNTVCMYSMYLCMFVYMYVYYMYVGLKECMCYLVQMLSNSDYRKVSDNQPMIGLNGPGKTLPCLHPLLLLISSRETS